MSGLEPAFALVFNPYVLSVIFGAAIFGLVLGAIPGLTATMATALLVPITFFMDPVPAIGAIVTTSAMAIFAGDLPAVLLRIPGTPSSAAYLDDVFAMRERGRPELALGIALVCSSLGGIFGTIVLVTLAPWLARFALNFTSYEYFWLACLGLTCAAVISAASPVKGFISVIIGLLLATVGGDIMSAYPRFTFGHPDLIEGIGVVPALIGMFAIPVLIRNAAAVDEVPPKALHGMSSIFHGLGGELWRYRLNMVRGWIVGTLIGALPGAGAGIGAWVAMGVSKRLSRAPEKFGTGHSEGVIEATSANNAGLSGAWVPALVFGIPGDPITAIVIGVLFVKGITPGPLVFIQSADLVTALFTIFFLANIAMLVLGWGAIKWLPYVLRVPRAYLIPLILLFCVIGAFAISLMSVVVMLVLGLLAYVMEENGFPIAPAVLGLVLGGMVEENFLISAMKAEDELTLFLSRPVSIVLVALIVLLWLGPLVVRRARGRR